MLDVGSADPHTTPLLRTLRIMCRRQMASTNGETPTSVGVSFCLGRLSQPLPLTTTNPPAWLNQAAQTIQTLQNPRRAEGMVKCSHRLSYGQLK